MSTRTKMICTMGPAVASLQQILQLIDVGMNVARINFSHGTHQDHQKTIELLKQARALRAMPLAIMLDTKGPEIRVGVLRGGQITLQAGQELLLSSKSPEEGDGERLWIHPLSVLASLEKGMSVLFDDGYIASEVKEITSEGVVVTVQNGGILKSQKGVNMPNARLDLPAMTQQDVEDISFGCSQDVDLIAASFIRSADHVLEIKRLLVEQGRSNMLVIAKIENSQGVQNIDSIIQAADGVMIARGDLGVELPLKTVPNLQKMMIRRCTAACKPVVTATQMLESMIYNPRPTRAEVSDVANAIYDGTSAVMLSGETAIGKYPIEAAAMMKSVVSEAEQHFDYREFFYQNSRGDFHDVSTSLAVASVKTAYSAGAKAIFAFTNSGFTARLISRFRPEMPILALTADPKVYHQLALNWGVIPVDPVQAANVHEAFVTVECFAMKRGVVRYGDLAIVTAGSPFGISGTTNMMIVESIGDVLLRGDPGKGKKIHGRVALLLVAEEPRALKGCIAVIARCDESDLGLLKYAIGIVLQNAPGDVDSEKHARQIAKVLDIPLLANAENAFKTLKEGQIVTLDPERGILYKGSVRSEEEMVAKLCPP